MSRDILILVNSISKEKSIPESTVFGVFEDVLSHLAKKEHTEGEYVTDISHDTGDYLVYRKYDVITDDFNGEYNKEVHIYDDMVAEFLKSNETSFESEDNIYLYTPVELSFGRQQASQAKQVLAQKLKDVVFEEGVKTFLDSDNLLISGTIKEFKKGIYIIDNGKMDFVLPKSECLPKDMFKVGQKVKAVYLRTERNKGLKKIVVSRISNQFVEEVIKYNVGAVEDGEIDVVGMARVPGFKTKIILKIGNNSNANQKFALDPVKVFVGMKGMNIKSISSELQGEIIEVYKYKEDMVEQLFELVSPLEISSVMVDEEKNIVDIAVMELGKNILVGKTGTNIKLISELLNYNVNVYTQDEWDVRKELEVETFKTQLMEDLDIDDEVALILIDCGFNTSEDVAYVPKEELLSVEGFDDEIVEELRSRARQVSVLNEIKRKGSTLVEFDALGFTKEEIKSLTRHNIKNVDDVADLALFELQEYIPNIEEERGIVILHKARGVV